MRVLNLYSGIGGNRWKWLDVHVTAIEINPEIAEEYQKHFPDDEVIVGDAHKLLPEMYQDFDFIWSSPPCPSHSRLMKWTRHPFEKPYPDLTLYQEIIFLEKYFSGKYCVENVFPYYEPLIRARKIDRHLFWTNFRMGNFKSPKYKESIISGYKEELEEYLGIKMTRRIYDGSNDPAKVLRNCVHPDLGEFILNCARDVITKNNVQQINLFE